MKLSVSLLLVPVMSFGIAGMAGCSREVAHTEKTSSTWTGGTKHEETTVRKNPNGSLEVEHEKQVTHP